MANDLSMLTVSAIVPMLFAIWFATGTYRTLFSVSGRVSDILSVAALTAILLFSLLAGIWVMGSYWLRPLVAILLVIGWGRWLLGKFPGFFPDSTLIGRISQGFLYLIGVVAGGISFLAIQGQFPPPATVDLAFPLKDRTFVIGQGGSSVAVNAHHRSVAQKYAIDILAMNVLGRNKSGFGSQGPESYAIWNAEVVAPCGGRVVWMRDGIEDSVGPNNDPDTPAGNAVAIECGAITVFLAHLKESSIAVQQGQNVLPGDPIGRVGNSGNTSEPHLHIHAESGPFDGELSDNQGIAILFDDDFPVRNDIILK